MQIDLYNQQGKKLANKVEVFDSVFGSAVNDNLLSQYVYVYLTNQRAAIAHTKGRGDVSGGGRKPFRQKGTGNARAGSNRSPIWTKGGITFGPSKDRNWKKLLPKKMRTQAIRSAFSKLQSEGQVMIVDQIAFDENRLTKQAVELIAAIGNPKKVLVITPNKQGQTMKAFANIAGARVVQVSEVNVYDLLTGGKVILMQEALDYIAKWS